jgi:cell division protein ZapA (FtsZ GTPase activity inhibitor)
MSPARRLRLEVLGRILTLRTEASPDYLRALAAELEARVTKFRDHATDAHSALALAALELADELAAARDALARGGEVSARLGALVAQLEAVTPRLAEEAADSQIP